MIQKLPFRISSIATAAAIVLLPAIFTFAQGTVNSRRIIAPVNDSDRVALAGSTPKNLSSMKDLGAAGTSMVGHHVTVVLQRTASQQAALAQYLSDVQNSESSQYHKWLTPADYGARFGVEIGRAHV